MFLFCLLACQTPKEDGPELIVQIRPENPNGQDTLTIELQSPGQLTLDNPSVQWLKNGSPYNNPTETLDPSHTQKGDEWSVNVLVQTNNESLKASSEAVTILNTPPTIQQVELSPVDAVAGIDSLNCTVLASDPDTDLIDITYNWFFNSESFSASDSEIPAAVTEAGEWVCQVSVSDGTDEVEESSNTAMVVQGEPLDGPLISNGGFELADFTGWTVEGPCEVVDILDYLQPAEGEWFAFGGEQDHCTLTQNINLRAFGFDDERIDNGQLRVELSSILANFDVADDFDDQVTAMVIFDDGFGSELGRIETLIAGSGQWMLREAERLIPPNTRALQFRIEGELRMDNINHSHIDDVQLEISETSERTPIFTKAPMLQDYRVDAMTIVWETDSADHTPYVEWGQSGNLDSVHYNIRSIWVTESHVVHVAEIEGLEMDTAYDYRVCGADRCSDEATFKTAPPSTSPVRIAWMADNQEGDHRFRTHLEHIDSHEPDLLFVAGDLLQYGDELVEWNTKWWDPLQTNSFAQYTPTLIARGNHDREHPFAYAYTHMPENGAWYQFQYGSVFAVVLNTHAPANNQNPNRDQLVYLTQALSSPQAQAADFRVVTFHQSPYTNATQHNTTGCESCRQWWVPVFEDYGVDLVISGHFHSYQRGEQNGVTYVIVAGGGSALLIDTFDNWDFMTVQQTWMYSIMDVVDGQMTWETYNLQDELIDAFQLTAR
ncbi:MAG: metallophosphoesterase [Myxococcota bacterium]